MLLTLLSSVSASGLRMVAMTCQPLAAKYWAVTLPMPLLAPVIKIVFMWLGVLGWIGEKLVLG